MKNRIAQKNAKGGHDEKLWDKGEQWYLLIRDKKNQLIWLRIVLYFFLFHIVKKSKKWSIRVKVKKQWQKGRFKKNQ